MKNRQSSLFLMRYLLLTGALLGNSACSGQPANQATATTNRPDSTVTAPDPARAAMEKLWAQWNDPNTQRIAPFKIFDNVYYVGMQWVAAYLLVTDTGLVLIDSLYGQWTEELIDNIKALGFDPAKLDFVILTHGHFDHAGGAATLQSRFGARIVMTAQDWALVAEPAADPRLATPVPRKDIVAGDGDVITSGNTNITLLHTPGHTTGVLSLRYQVFDNGQAHEAITLGGVGRNFSGLERTKSYINSYQRLLEEAGSISVNLPNHAAMGQVFARAEQLRQRSPNTAHPFVDRTGYTDTLQSALAAGQQKLLQERTGTAKSPLEELSDTINRPPS